MNYFIQGDAAKADKIRAAFEKLGIDTLNYNFKCNGMMYFSWNGKVKSIDIDTDFFKTRPDYKELELPVDPKFKVGNWYLCVKDVYGRGVRFDKGNAYHCGKDECLQQVDSGAHISIVEELYEYFRPWTIADAQNGDVLATGNIICIFKKLDKDGYYIISPCIYTVKGGLEVIDNEDDTIGSCGFKPATKEDRELLFRKIKEAGYKWDAEKKELRKIQLHYDIANFHAGMPVLVRETSLNAWQYVLFSHCYIGGDGLTRFNAGLVGFTQCIPFEGNEALLGTTDMPSEEFINW